jgi:hypothetical protein
MMITSGDLNDTTADFSYVSRIFMSSFTGALLARPGRPVFTTMLTLVSTLVLLSTIIVVAHFGQRPGNFVDSV